MTTPSAAATVTPGSSVGSSLRVSGGSGRAWLVGLALSLVLPSAAWSQGTRLLRHPAVSRDQVAFEYGGDLWVVSRAGGRARRLTATPGVETDPHFSPDGSMIAFTATVAGNTDVYVVSSQGGEPKRLTYHPDADRVRGWTPDGRRVVFASARLSPPQHSYDRLFLVSVDGGLPEPIALPRAFAGVYSPDGRRIAYQEISREFIPDWHDASFWRHYRGGRTEPIRIFDPADDSVTKLPWTNSNDTDPMWVGNTIYFLSDRDFTSNVFAYRTDTRTLTQLTHHDDFDVMNATAGPDAVVYEQAGYIHLIDTRTGQSQQLNIEVSGEFPWARPQFKAVADMIRSATLSPTGVRVALEARGDVFTVPVEKGDYRDLTSSSGAHEQDPVWSPDGTQLAWLSDASGEYQLVIGDQTGTGATRTIPLPSHAFPSELAWSPDGKMLSFTDSNLNLWTLDVKTGKATKVDTETYEDPEPERTFGAVWSPDSRWLAYSKSLDNHFRAIFLYSLVDGKRFQLTDGLSDAVSPAFDAGGDYLYFMASTDYGPRTGWLEMSSIDRPVRRSIYLVVLAADRPSPFLPETGDEPGPAKGGTAKPATDSLVRVDVQGIDQRILSLGVPSRDYHSLQSGAAGTIFYEEPMGEGGPGVGYVVQRYQLKDRAGKPFLSGVQSYTLSADHKKLLYAAGRQWGVVAADAPSAKVGDGSVDMAQLQMRVDPLAEWAEIFRETWREQRDFFYDSHMHGADWQAVYDKYAPLVAYVRHRDDLSYLIAQTGGELVVGHSYLTGAGDVPTDEPVSVGMLGADLSVENGHYRIHHIYRGENWNPDLRAPLSAPGIDVAEGDYLLAVNGHALVPPENPYSAFEGTANHQTILRVGPAPSAEGSRLITVVPVASEHALRSRAWVERNRAIVDSLSHGRLAYVWLPNTAGGGYTYFTRYFYAQQDRDGVIIDERYNQGGQIADYIVNELNRQRMGYFATRAGKPTTSPMAGIFGPKVMIINESAGSGGDALPYYFRLRKLGPLVGTRTWGGLVGTLGVPPTIDGGGITAPDLAFYDLSGHWAVENEGITPDVPVENTPAAVIAGHDPQLERAVAVALKLLEENPVGHVARPAPIDRASRHGH
jgi:tricorn protease